MWRKPCAVFVNAMTSVKVRLSPTTRISGVSDEAASCANIDSSEKRKSSDFNVRPPMPERKSSVMFTTDFFMRMSFCPQR